MDEWELHESRDSAEAYWDCAASQEEFYDPLWEPGYHEELVADEDDENDGSGDETEETPLNEEPSID